MTFQKVEAKAAELNKKLSHLEFSSSTYVHVVTDEGFRADMPSAFVLKHKKWYIIFSEHHDPLCFDKDDIVEIYTYTRSREKFTNLKDYIPLSEPAESEK